MNKTSTTTSREHAERLGAGILAGLAMLVSVELMLEHAPHTGKQGAHHSHHGSVSEIFARGEGKGETARLPEEFDIGLQTPNIAGL